MTNTSATGGYLSPTTEALPGDLSLSQFLHDVIVGITGLPNKNVRPKWQVEPALQLPNPLDNWCAFAVIITNPDANAYVEGGENESRLQRHEDLQLICSFYGELSNENAAILRDGFQVSQNREVLSTANMGFTEALASTFVPELVNNRWFPRTDITIRLSRQVKRTYKVLSMVGAEGAIEANTTNEETINVPFDVTQ